MNRHTWNDLGPSSYLLPEHVHLCLSGHQIVLLDLASDEYLALDAVESLSLAEVVPGWPVPEKRTPGSVAPANCATAVAMARTLSDRGLLTSDLRRGKPAQPIDIALPTVSLVAEQSDTRPALHRRHVTSFVSAAAAAAYKLRWTPIARVVRSIERQRRARGGASVKFDANTARSLVDVFYHLRPFFFTAHNACLFDSLALILFLARFGLFPEWVFAVQTAPFGAHCWVQHGDIVLNDSVEHVRRYTPIMAV